MSHLRTRLQFGAGDRAPNSVLVAGALPREGRTRTAVDLAKSVACTGRRVILVEADLRHPCLAEELGLRGTHGLTDVLTGTASLHDALEDCGDGRLRVLPSGPGAADPGTLLSSPNVAQLVRTLEAHADLVVVDSPPLLPFADGVALAATTDAVLFVVRAGRTRREAALRALDALSAVHALLLGAVLTGRTHGEGLRDRQPHGEPESPDHAFGETARPDHIRMSDGRPRTTQAAAPHYERHHV